MECMLRYLKNITVFHLASLCHRILVCVMYINLSVLFEWSVYYVILRILLLFISSLSLRCCSGAKYVSRLLLLFCRDGHHAQAGPVLWWRVLFGDWKTLPILGVWVLALTDRAPG